MCQTFLDGLGGSLGSLWLGYTLVSLSVAQGFRIKPKLMRSEINLEIEIEILSSEIKSFHSLKIKDPTLLPSKLPSSPTSIKIIH